MPSIQINDTTIHYLRTGVAGGPRLLLSHSLFFDLSMFEPLIELLKDRFEIVAYDHRGQGASGRKGALDMDNLTRDAAALIAALDFGPCQVAGNSMGGFVALRLAARYPHLVAGCIVMGSSADLEHKLAAFEPLVEDLARNGPADHIDTLMHIMFGDDIFSDPAREPLLAHWRSKMLDLDTGIGAAARGVIHRQSVLPEIALLEVPLLVLAGEQDHAYSIELSQQIVDTSGHGDMYVIPGAGHSVALEAPEAVAQRIGDFAEA
ncbi:alpha/beta fold hydrolase [Halopseudomonas salina]|uniref:3-oxoadipate enol-lactonase n=1 Tax=Halopseudomonas salina TaxID=1323744 RepID=A0ABQ1PTT6_9GAMM|nr:alpha/beta hydrolase [Halopseudomonas salina]GGD03839.1 3-oxoadipate enol-lactonase [Halopseudomonas salina]